eukprot:symbB.v1.2.021008.t1/scaffold1777.1/size101761/3
MSSSSSGQPIGGKDPPQLAERFLLLDDVVAKELSELDYPWNLKAIEERIDEYSSVSEAINVQLSARVMQNYNDFVSGMQMVQSVETELSLIGVLIKNGRRKLQIHDQGILRGSMQITRQHRRRQRLKELLSLLEDLQSVVEIDARLQQSIDEDHFAEAIIQHSVLRDTLASAEYRRFPGVVGLQQSMANNLTLVQQKLSERLRVSAVSADFDAEKYEEVLKAYSLLSSDQAISVGKELLRHVSEFIVAVSRQCMLAFSSRNESPDWHKRAQLRELCKSMDPAHVVACILQLYEHLCNFLYRHQFLCAWHLCRSQAAEEENAPNQTSFRELLSHVHTELVSSKRNVWQGLQQQVSLVLMTLDFQYPALSEESFMQILHLTQLLMDEVPGAMSAVLDFLPFPMLSLPKRVIIQNRKLNLIYYLAHLPILGYAVLSFVVNMSYTEEIPNTPFTLIELNPVDAEPFLQYQLNNDPSEQVRTYCKDGEAGTFAVDCSLEDDAEICRTMFGFLLMTPFTLKVDFDCTRICEKTLNGQDPKCFLPPTALLSQGSQQMDLVVANTIDSGPPAPGVMVRTMRHRTHPMIRDTVIAFTYSFRLVQPAPPLFGLEDSGARKTNNDAMTVIIDSKDIVRRLFSPGEVINITIAEIVEAAGAEWNYTMVFQGSEFIVSTNCFTAPRDLPAAIYWSGIAPFYPREDLPLCLIRFSWLQDSHVSYSLEGGFGRDVKIRLFAQNGTSFSRLPSIEFSLLNLVSMVVLLSIPPAVTGWMARTFLGPLSKIYRQATQEKFDMPSQLATAGLNCIANVATFGSLASTTLSKEELKVCLKDALAHSKKQLEEKDLNRLTNFVFEKDPRYPLGARRAWKTTMAMGELIA